MNDRLKIIVENMSQINKDDPDAFSLARRMGFGASDSSVLLGVNPFPNGTIEKLIEQKRSTTVTEDEKAIGKMVNVRKGTDLEPLILQKFAEKHNIPLEDIMKPDHMYNIIGTPLNVNYDGVMKDAVGRSVAVELKYVSAYGGKYYNRGKSRQDLMSLYDLKNLGTEVNNIYLMKRAEEAGVPIYYYTQVQQQLYGLDAPYGYLGALFDKDWEIDTYVIMADPLVQQRLIDIAQVVWNKI